MSWNGLRTRLRLLFARGAAESRMNEEIGFHLEMEAERLVREEGLHPAEARRRARVAFGGVERTKEELRSSRGLAWLSGLRLDLKLGARMLVKYPVLTAASMLALTIAVAMAAAWFQFMGNMVRPTLPIPGGDRVVTVKNLDLETASTEPQSLHDFETWRRELGSVEDLSAGTSVTYNVTTETGRFQTLEGMAVTASMFRLAAVQPMLGRTLTERDAAPGADPVVVLEYTAWQRLFDEDVRAIGQTVKLGGEYATVVGVMPPDFGFPVNEEIWVPLRARAVEFERRDGPAIGIYGRLAPGTSVKEAQAELELIGQRTAAEFPSTHERLRPEVQFYGRGNDMAAAAAFLNVPFLLFLVVVSANVATLLFARTASRESEIAMRSALGASRRRLVLQLVAESLVLTLGAAVLGLVLANWGMGWGMELFWQVQQMRPPFWFDGGVSAASAAYVLILATVGAIIIGGIPGLRATRRQLRDRLPQAGAEAGGMRFGSVATGVIIVQVGLCVAFLPIAIVNGRDLIEDRRTSDFPADTYLSAQIVRAGDLPGGQGGMPPAADADGRRAELFDEVHRRLGALSGVTAATRAHTLPGFNHGISTVEVEGDSARTVGARRLAVDPDFFEVLGARIISGRGFHAEDVTGALDVAILDEGWARDLFPGESAIGKRIRFPHGEDGQETPWHEVVGIVAGADRVTGPGSYVALYEPLRPGQEAGVRFYLRTDVPPEALMPDVVDLVTAVDPGFAITHLAPLDEIWAPVERSDVFFTTAIGVVGAIILLFALMGIYALMSFTVARRAREIGVRAALGAEPRRIITAIFSRAMAQIGIGVVLGAAVISLTVFDDPGELRLVAGVAAAMVVVGLMGCVLPAVRALRIQPTEALRAE